MADTPTPPQTSAMTRRSPIDTLATLAALGLSTYAVVRVLALEETVRKQAPPASSSSLPFRSQPTTPPLDAEDDDDERSDLDSVKSDHAEEKEEEEEEEVPPPPAPPEPPEVPQERRGRRSSKSVSSSS